jgi:hypothetical protein
MAPETDPETSRETVRWLSYAEFGRLRGVSAATARRMANRRRWPKLPGNDGTVRVAVPPEALAPRETQGETEAEMSRETVSPFHARALAALEAALMTLTGQLADAQAREAGHAAEVRALRAQIAEAEAVRALARAEAQELRARVAEADMRLVAVEAEAGQARAEAQAAQDALDQVECASAARKARGRLRRAWDSWRGR